MAIHTAGRLILPVSDRDHLLGSENASVTLLEYGDYECPYCRQAYPVVNDLMDMFGDNLLVAYRHFPLATVHPHAQQAAEAAEAAGAQDRFWEMHDHLYENQDALDQESLIDYAEELSLDMEQFETDLAEHRHAARIQEDVTSGIRSGVNGTPTFFINGVRYDGSFDLESLASAITDAAEAVRR
jgi:protein-disulfide isomerase